MPPKVSSRPVSKRPAAGLVPTGSAKKAKAARKAETAPTIPAPTPAAIAVSRCAWAQGELDQEYHDKEWGVFRDDDKHLFEMLILEGRTL